MVDIDSEGSAVMGGTPVMANAVAEAAVGVAAMPGAAGGAASGAAVPASEPAAPRQARGVSKQAPGPDFDAAEARLLRAGRQDKLATGILTAIVCVVMAIVVAMVVYILVEGVSTLVQPGFLTQPSRANGTEGGVVYQLFDSFYLLVITLVISVPISLGGAVFLVEYAPDGPIRDIASTAIETLSSLPSIVVGMFGFLVFSVNFGWKYSLISGALALTMFNIPILVRVIQQALEDVPQSQRDACLAMGLTRWEATLHILIPAAMPAIVTGIVLSPVRLNFLSLNFSSPTCAWNVFRPGESLAVHIYKIYGEGSPQAQQIVWGTAALLMICVLLFNIIARLVGKLLAKKMTAE